MRYTPYIHTIQHNTHTRFRPDLVILAAGGVVMTVCTLGSPSCRRPVPVDSRDGRWVVDAQKADCQTSGVCLYVFTASAADPHPKPRGFAATGRRDLLSKHISSLRRASARRLFAAGLPPPIKDNARLRLATPPVPIARLVCLAAKAESQRWAHCPEHPRPALGQPRAEESR